MDLTSDRDFVFCLARKRPGSNDDGTVLFDVISTVRVGYMEPNLTATRRYALRDLIQDTLKHYRSMNKRIRPRFVGYDFQFSEESVVFRPDMILEALQVDLARFIDFENPELPGRVLKPVKGMIGLHSAIESMLHDRFYARLLSTVYVVAVEVEALKI